MSKATEKQLRLVITVNKLRESLIRLKKLAEAFFFIGNAAKMVMGGVRMLWDTLSGMLSAWGQQERAIVKLNTALRATGIYAPQTSRDLQQIAKDLQATTTFGDEMTLQSMALMQSLARLNSDGLKAIMPSVMDFAVGMGIDLNTAVRLIGKTLGSNTNALERYGIAIDATAPKQQKLAELQAGIAKMFGGQAAAEVQTYEAAP